MSTNIFVNRNRSQGDYGIPLNNQKFRSTEQSWLDRAKRTNDSFYKESNKYNLKKDYQNTHVPVGWSLLDVSNVVKQESLPHQTISNETNGVWKQFNNYERKDFKQKTQEALKDEINNLALKIHEQRTAMGNSTYSNNQQSWRVPDVEVMDRTFQEGARFFTPGGKTVGTRYVCPPKADNLQQLIDDQIKSEMKSPNVLLNGRYAKSR